MFYELFLHRFFKLTSLATLTLLVGLYAGFSFAGKPTPPPPPCDPNASHETVAKVTACININDLTAHMIELQNTADMNNADPSFSGGDGAVTDISQCPYPVIKDGHTTRDGGTCGNLSSRDYVATKMRDAGYTVTIQSMPFQYSLERSPGIMAEVSPIAHTYIEGVDYSPAVFSATGEVTAPLQVVGLFLAENDSHSVSGCSATDFVGFVPGNIALMERGTCPNQQKVLNAIAAGATGAITANFSDVNIGNTLLSPVGITVPAFAYIPYSVGIALVQQVQAGPVVMHMKADVLNEERTTYNVIADSPSGDLANTVVLVSHLDSLYSSGMLDNGSGNITILDVALALKKTPTLNHMRYIWTGAEEQNTDGAQYYVTTLKSKDFNNLAFVLDADVTATKNYIVEVQSLANTTYTSLFAGLNAKAKASGSGQFQTQVIKASQLATDLFKTYFASVNIPTVDSSRESSCGSDGCIFGSYGIPFGIAYTGQGTFGGGKTDVDQALYDANPIPGTTGGTGSAEGVAFENCADTPFVYCDNLTNVDYNVLYAITKGYAAVTVQLAFTKNLKGLSQQYKDPSAAPIDNTQKLYGGIGSRAYQP